MEGTVLHCKWCGKWTLRCFFELELVEGTVLFCYSVEDSAPVHYSREDSALVHCSREDSTPVHCSGEDSSGAL